jgi:phosphatidate cytidylyltransferase
LKVRVISSIVALVILAFVLIFYNSFVFPVALGIVSAIAVYELLGATSYIKYKPILFLSSLLALLYPFIISTVLKEYAFAIIMLYGIVLCTALLIKHDELDFANVSVALVVSFLVSSSMSIFLVLRNSYKYEGLFYIFLVFIGAWISDTGAYFTGILFGKHKLSPRISPKKTIEGFFGGLLTATLGYMLGGFIFSYVMPLIYPEIAAFVPNYVILALIAPICSAAGVVGDLTASVIKRQTNLKDFGNIMPGHGGVMDRFDSVLFVAPMLFIILKYFPVNFVIVTIR